MGRCIYFQYHRQLFTCRSYCILFLFFKIIFRFDWPQVLRLFLLLKDQSIRFCAIKLPVNIVTAIVVFMYVRSACVHSKEIMFNPNIFYFYDTLKRLQEIYERGKLKANRINIILYCFAIQCFYNRQLSLYLMVQPISHHIIQFAILLNCHLILFCIVFPFSFIEKKKFSVKRMNDTF